MLRQLAPSAAKRKRCGSGELVPLAGPRHSARPPAIPAAREPEPAADTGHGSGRPVRVRHTARHARTSEPRPRNPSTSLSIRSAERRRWAADLSGPGQRRPCRLRHGRHRQVDARGPDRRPGRAAPVQPGHERHRAARSRRGRLRGSGFRPGRGRLHRPGELRRQPVLRVGPVDRPRPGPGRPARHLDGQAADHLPAPVRPGRAAGLDPPGPAAPGPADPFRRRRAHHRAARDRLLGEAERDQVWRLTAGHPLAMEYLDRLLARGERYPELADRLETAIRGALKAAPRGRARSRRPACRGPNPPSCPTAAAELIASAAGEVMFGELFDRLGAGARSLLVRAAAYRGPVAAGPAGRAARQRRRVRGGRPAHHRLRPRAGRAPLDGALHRRMAAANLGGQLAAAHRQAAAYWLSRPDSAASSRPPITSAVPASSTATGAARGPPGPAAADGRVPGCSPSCRSCWRSRPATSCPSRTWRAAQAARRRPAAPRWTAPR